MEDPQKSPFSVISESDLKKMEDDNESTTHNIQQLVRNRLGRQREQIMKKRSALYAMNEMASQQPVQLSVPRDARESISTEILATNRQSQEPKAIKEKKESALLELTADMIKKGLLCHGYHPFLLRHTFLRLEVPSLELKSIDALSSYENLMYLNLADNAVEDLSILSKFPSLLQLNASGNELTTCLDFAPPHCNQNDAWSTGHIALGSILINADVSNNHISALGSLARHPYLECLLAGNNLIRTIEGLSTLRFLQVLDLSDNGINVIQGLQQLPIRELNLAGNNLLTLHGLEELHELAYLNISRNKITCLAPLKKCANLSFLDAQHNDLNIIRQVEFLKDLEWLRHLILLGNPASFIPFYRYCVIHIIPLIQFLDRSTVSVEEKIKSANMFNDEFNDVASRKIVFEKYFPGESFRNFGPVFVDDESSVDLAALEAADDKLEELVREKEKEKEAEAAQ